MQFRNPFADPKWPDIPFEEIKKRARILVIDDTGFPYVTLFERDGYTLEKWSDVDDLPKLESNYYDILLLDLQGVGRKQSSQQGLGILKHLRQSTPGQIVVAFSSADFSLKAQEFFEMADAVLSKSSDYVDFKKVVDKLLQDRFSLGFYLTRLETVVGPHLDDSSKLEKEARQAILRRDTGNFKRFLQEKTSDPQVIKNALSVVDIGIKIAALWMK